MFPLAQANSVGRRHKISPETPEPHLGSDHLHENAQTYRSHKHRMCSQLDTFIAVLWGTIPVSIVLCTDMIEYFKFKALEGKKETLAQKCSQPLNTSRQYCTQQSWWDWCNSYKSLQTLLFTQRKGKWQSNADLRVKSVPISHLFGCTGVKLTFILTLELVSPFYFSTQQAEHEEFILWRNQSSQRQTPFPEVTQQSLTTGDISYLVIRVKSHMGSDQFNKRPVLQAKCRR